MSTKQKPLTQGQIKRRDEYFAYLQEIDSDPILKEIKELKEQIKEYELEIKKSRWRKQSEKLETEQKLARARNKLRLYIQRYGHPPKNKSNSKRINARGEIRANTSDINEVASDQLEFMKSLTELHYIKDKNFFNTALDEFRKKYVTVSYHHDKDSGVISRNVGTKDLKTKESKDWFSKKIKGLVNQHIKNNDNGFLYTEIMNNKSATSQSTVNVGNVYFFGYNPKFWKDLPLYDLFPLVLVTNISGKHMYGLNLHYLPRKQRMGVLTKCLGLKSENEYESKVVEEVEKYLNESFELMDTDIAKFDEYFDMIDSFNELNDEYANAKNPEERESILKTIKEDAAERGYGTGKETGLYILKTYSENLDNILRKIKLNIKDKRELFLKDLNNLKSDKRIKAKELDSDNLYYPKLFKKYILDEGRIANGRFIHIPIEEYRFVVDLPGYWMETDMKSPRKNRTATHTTRRYQY